MIYSVSTFTIPDSIGNELKQAVMEWLRKTTKYVQSTWPEIELELLTNYDGSQMEVHWMSKHESMAEAEKVPMRFHQDDGMASLLAEAVSAAKKKGSTPYLTNHTYHYYRIVDLD